MKRYMEFERNQAGIIQERYSCALCWNPVRVCHDKDGDYVTCGTDGCSCRYLITTGWVNLQVKNRNIKSLEAKEVLSKFLPVKQREKKTEKELMSQLGF